MGTRVYLDTCCVHRPFDDQASLTVHSETEAILGIVECCLKGEYVWLGSDVLRYETGRATAAHVIEGSGILLEAIHEWVSVTEDTRRRAKELETHGIRPLDALHLASAESGQADVFLTVDAKLLRAAARREAGLAVRVADPVGWAREEGIR